MTLYSRPGTAARPSSNYPAALSRTEVLSLQHARQAIETTTGQRIVQKVLISHSQLGDDGCVALFDLLGSAQGRKHPVSDIHLGSNNIGDKGLLAIADYLKDNVHLYSLQLPHNQFTGDAATIAAFVQAINTSRLKTLNLASNDNLGDAFVEAFFPALRCTTLRNLNVTATRLTGRSVDFITAYLSSNQFCHLRIFSCNANQLGTPGVKSIINAIRRYNYRLTEVNIYSNYGEVENLEEAVEQFKEALLFLRQTVNRNNYFTRETEEQALRLLRYSRPVLLSSSEVQSSRRLIPCIPSCSIYPANEASIFEAGRPQSLSPNVKLPIEIKQHILSFLAPTLSAAQRIRIYHYASLPSTLPELLPSLPSFTIPRTRASLCVPDPSSLGFGNSSKVWSTEGICAGGICMGAHNSVMNVMSGVRRFLHFESFKSCTSPSINVFRMPSSAKLTRLLYHSNHSSALAPSCSWPTRPVATAMMSYLSAPQRNTFAPPVPQNSR
ncbi:hypothetical protein LshimejAT787_1102030 [Lyophyllum shimeji]|uniref:RNI-like protein n=1 Tax=Lyophyllum shimeji TaxID=47721 RepID=A0A9P3UR14_LYOSH|nr:hypothetical protein LshimejAT787_1102030 [Lyophyllum shimeji]